MFVEFQSNHSSEVKIFFINEDSARSFCRENEVIGIIILLYIFRYLFLFYFSIHSCLFLFYFSFMFFKKISWNAIFVHLQQRKETEIF